MTSTTAFEISFVCNYLIFWNKQSVENKQTNAATMLMPTQVGMSLISDFSEFALKKVRYY